MTTLAIALPDAREWLDGALAGALWAQVGVIVAAAGIAWLVHRYWDRYLSGVVEEHHTQGLRRLTLRSAQRVVFPFTMLILVLAGRSIVAQLGEDVRILDIAVPLLLSLAAIRLTVYILRKGFRPSPALKAWEQTISTLVWLGVALHLIGWLPGVLQAMDNLAFMFGHTRVSLLAVVKLVVLGAVALILASWLSNVIERRVLPSAHLSVGMQVGLVKFTKFFLITIAVLVALNGIGVDLTALTVFGGALGVGLGLGLQRIASNFISGFILVFDRSIRPGDVITIGDSFGWVQELRARYVVIRNRDGVDTLIPNENLITSEVINWSYSDRNVRLKIPVQISYRDDPELAMSLMAEAARSEPRILKDPEPVVRLMGFGDNGINLELRVWIRDPEEGVNNVRSSVNLAIWRAFQARGITIPFPQRDLYLQSVPPGLGSSE